MEDRKKEEPTCNYADKQIVKIDVITMDDVPVESIIKKNYRN